MSVSYLSGYGPSGRHRLLYTAIRRSAGVSSAIAVGSALLLATAQVRAADAVQTGNSSASTTDASVDASSSQQATKLNKVEIHATRSLLATKQDVPQSTSVVTGKELERLDAVTLGDITERAANVSWNLGNSRTSSLSIRGIGKQAQTDAMDPSVGVVVDGVAYAYNPLSSFDFTDLADVEVERGPQGTQGGKNANLGVIDITTRRPSFTPEADVSVTLGEYNTVLSRAAGGGPIIDDLLAWRGSLSVDKGDGAIKNVYNSDYSYPNLDNVSGRVQFLLTPSADFNAIVRLDLEPRHSEFYNGWVLFTPTPTVYGNGAPNPLSTDASTRLARSWFTQEGSYNYSQYLGTRPDLDNQDPLVTLSKGGSVEMNWNLGSHTLTSISAYKDYRFQARNDEGTPFSISENGGGNVSYRQGSEELRLSSKQGGFVDYQTGLYFLRTANNYDSGSGYGSDAGAWFASNAQYNVLDADGDGRYLMSNSLNRLIFKPLQIIRNESDAVYGQANWHFSEPFTVTTGLRFSREDRTNIVSKYIYDNGFAAELDPAIVNGVNLGGFNSTSTGALGTNSAAQLALANATAQKYFGVSSYSALSATQMAQVAAAKAIRQSQLGVLWNATSGPEFRSTQPSYVFSPSYKINDQVTAYVSFRYGEKAGISQVINGVPYLAKPEDSAAYEAGFKTLLLNKTLVLDADVFLNNIKNYQQLVEVFDQYTTNLNANGTNYYTTATGNAPRVRSTGLELDSTYTPIPNLSIRVAAAYTNAIYVSFPTSGQPLENANLATPYRDVSGQNLPGAAKFTGNLGLDFREGVASWGQFHSSVNYAYTSRYNSDVALSSYGWVHANGTADFSTGLTRKNDKFDVSLLVKNLFNNDVSQVVTWNSYVPAIPRWFGVQFSSKF